MSYVAIYEAEGMTSVMAVSHDLNRLIDEVFERRLPQMAEEADMGPVATLPIEDVGLACFGNHMMYDDGTFGDPFETATIYEADDV